MGKQIVKLDNQEIKEAIEAGDNASGSRWLAVSPDGEARVYWADTNRQWDPWQDGDAVIGLPALFPEGRGEEWEMCEDIAKQLGLNVRDIEDEIEETGEFSTLVDYIVVNHPDYYEAHKSEMLDWLADAFLAACNGDGSDLTVFAPWGMFSGDFGPDTVVEPPFSFEWK